MEIIRISAAGIACVLAAIFMKTAKPEYSVYLTMAAGLFILAFAVGKFSYLYESLKKIQQYVPVDTTYMNMYGKAPTGIPAGMYITPPFMPPLTQLPLHMHVRTTLVMPATFLRHL